MIDQSNIYCSEICISHIGKSAQRSPNMSVKKTKKHFVGLS